MQAFTFRKAQKQDKPRIVEFMRQHWDVRHPLIELPDFFAYYYEGPGEELRFVLCEDQGQLAALAGYIPASQDLHPDIWVSIWVADKAAKGSGLELMAALPQVTGCRTMACNNIRPNTRVFYEFLGYTTGRMGHFYRLADQEHYHLAQVAHKDILPVQGGAVLQRLDSQEALLQSGFVPPAANPQKDLWYMARRYFAYPRQSYQVYLARMPGQPQPQALLALRVVPCPEATVMRIADYIGDSGFLPQCGPALQQLLEENGAEYMDFYVAGIDAEILAQAGFSERMEQDDNILPNYLEPPLLSNTEYYYFTSQPEGFVLCKADGDQDRPRVEGY